MTRRLQDVDPGQDEVGLWTMKISEEPRPDDVVVEGLLKITDVDQDAVAKVVISHGRFLRTDPKMLQEHVVVDDGNGIKKIAERVVKIFHDDRRLDESRLENITAWIHPALDVRKILHPRFFHAFLIKREGSEL
jgi:hypothetical protein